MQMESRRALKSLRPSFVLRMNAPVPLQPCWAAPLPCSPLGSPLWPCCSCCRALVCNKLRTLWYGLLVPCVFPQHWSQCQWNNPYNQGMQLHEGRTGLSCYVKLTTGLLSDWEPSYSVNENGNPALKRANLRAWSCASTGVSETRWGPDMEQNIFQWEAQCWCRRGPY